MKIFNLFTNLFTKNRRNYTEKEIFDYAERLIKCAGIDYSVAQILFKQKKKEYSAILYHLQQTVEKLVKAEMILRKLITISELKKISHKSPMAFLLGYQKATENKNVNQFLKDKVPKDKVKEAWKYLFNPKKIINSGKEELVTILNFYDVFKKTGLITQLYSEAENRLKDIKLELNLDRNEIFITLYFLSWLTFPYSEITRYPDGKIKPYEFGLDKPIVQIIPDLIKKIKPILKFMGNYKFDKK